MYIHIHIHTHTYINVELTCAVCLTGPGSNGIMRVSHGVAEGNGASRGQRPSALLGFPSDKDDDF